MQYQLPINKANVLSRASQEQIMKYYLQSDLEGKISSPFRKDNSPSCSVWKSKAGILYLKDWSTDQIWDCFGIVMEKFRLDFFDALRKINKDLCLGLGQRTSYHKCEIKVKEKSSNSKEVFYSLKDWDDVALSYWASYGISKTTLDTFNVYNVDKVWSHEKFMWQASSLEPTFLYKFNEGFKLYSPFSKLKWYSKVSHNVLNGWEQLKEHDDNLIITSSLKDVMVLYELGYSAIAPQGETVLIQNNVIDEIKDRFNNLYVFMDNDAAGMKANDRLSEMIGCGSFTTPDYLLPSKDISDVSAHWGLELAAKVVGQILEEYQDLSMYAEIPFINELPSM